MEASEFRQFVARLATALEASVVEEQGLLGVELELDEGRHQRVYLGLTTDVLGHSMLVAYTAIGEAADVDPLAVLELNASVPYGAAAVRNGKIIMRRTERLAALSPGALADGIRMLALNADVIEQTLYGRRDRY